MQRSLRHWLQFLFGFVICFAIRLFPGRPPNMEPILTTTMPFAKHTGPIGGFLFAFLNIIIFDFFTSGWGSWTAISAITYGLIGIAAWYVFADKPAGPLRYAAFAIPATLVYDFLTGVMAGVVFWDVSFTEAFLGQIPFTVNHLLGNIAFALVLSPLIDRWIAGNEALEWSSIRSAHADR